MTLGESSHLQMQWLSRIFCRIARRDYFGLASGQISSSFDPHCSQNAASDGLTVYTMSTAFG